MTSVLVIGEYDGEGLKSASNQVAGVAAKLGEVNGLLIGSGVTAVAATLPATKVLVADDAGATHYDASIYASTAAAAVQATGADIVMLGGTALGRDLGPRLAMELGWSYLADCVGAGPDGFVRANYAGKVLAKIPMSSNIVVTLRPNAFPVVEGGAGGVEAFSLTGTAKTTTTSIEAGVGGAIDIAEARVVVSGGRGIKEEGNFALIVDLADALGGAAGASRAIVDEGWVDHSQQVGQTGKTVSPELYVAAGISGAIQHLGGMTGSKCIVAINKDEDAPIFKVADYGIVGDLFEVLPLFIDAVK